MLQSQGSGLLYQIDRQMKAYENEIKLLKEELNMRRHRELHMARSFQLDMNIGKQSVAGTLPEHLDKPITLKKRGESARFILQQLDNKREFQHPSIITKYLKEGE